MGLGGYLTWTAVIREIKRGQEWSADYTQERYAERFVEILEIL